LYDRAGSLEQYRDGFTVTAIDGRDNSITFQNGIKLFAGDVKGAVNEQQLRRIQIRETILSHIERERMLYFRGIKVLSLFFIDEVAKYKQYDASGNAFNGSYADMFEEEYDDVVNSLQLKIGEDAYISYLKSIAAEKTHAGYFSIDKKKNQFVDGKVERSTRESVDTDAYDLIMKDKERLLSFSEPVRFIFSHSALREGWDNPNVFQICTLKQSDAETRKRQEVGRGLRLCVNQEGERMDTNFLGSEVHHINQLTVIASESYDRFAKALQTEIAEVIADRPQKVSPSLFRDKVLSDKQGNPYPVSEEAALVLYESLAGYGYVKAGTLTDKYYEDKESGSFQLPEEVEASNESVMHILDSVYNQKMLTPENARGNNVELRFDEQKFNREEFKKLWANINTKTAYVVDFETEELVRKAIQRLNNHLHVSKIFFTVTSGALEKIESKESLEIGEGFKQQSSSHIDVHSAVNGNVKYDLVGKVVAETGLTRNTVVSILTGIEKPVFDQFMLNPEEFILKCSNLINEEKATVIIQHIAYNKLNDSFGTEIFTEPTLKGKLGVNAIAANKHLYDYVIFDSPSVEKPFAEQLDISSEVSVYVKLPKGFYINTPVGKYNPDWAIAFNEGTVKHVYFVAETKGDISTMELREVESAKISCARKHFQAISSDKVKFDVVSNYKQLMSLVK
jgi:type III restriction enzyme